MNTVSIYKNNQNKIVFSEDGMFGKEDLVVLTNLSRLMVKNYRNSFHTYMDGSTARSHS